MVLWDSSPASSWSASFLNKVSIPPCPNSYSLVLLACHVASRRSLDSVIAVMIRFRALREAYLGLPWWSGGEEFALQCKGCQFDPWSSKIPHAVEQLNPVPQLLRPRFRTRELQLQSPPKVTTEACVPRACALQQEKPLRREARHHNKKWFPLATTRESPRAAPKDTAQPKVNK